MSKDNKTFTDKLDKLIVKLTTSNFPVWRKSVLDIVYLRAWPDEYFDISQPDWNGVEETQADAKKRRREAYSLLLYSIGEDLQYLLEGVGRGDVLGVWKAVHNQFLRKTSTNVTTRLKSFFSLTMQNTKTNVFKYISIIQREVTMLKQLGRELEEQEVITVILDGLSPPFAALVTSLQLNNKSLQECLEAIYDFAERKKLLNATSRETSYTPSIYTSICKFYNTPKGCYRKNCKFPHKKLHSESNSKSSQNNYNKNNQNQNNNGKSSFVPTCYGCGKKGHKKNECRNNNNTSKNNNNRYNNNDNSSKDNKSNNA